ncbi:MAG TPA: hypothetical protein VH500_18435 [Nitrososphaeraceae archaeon]|jgi:hypothetical protein
MGSVYRRLELKKSPVGAAASKEVMICEGGFTDKGPLYLRPDYDPET